MAINPYSRVGTIGEPEQPQKPAPLIPIGPDPRERALVQAMMNQGYQRLAEARSPQQAIGAALPLYAATFRNYQDRQADKTRQEALVKALTGATDYNSLMGAMISSGDPDYMKAAVSQKLSQFAPPKPEQPLRGKDRFIVDKNGIFDITTQQYVPGTNRPAGGEKPPTGYRYTPDGQSLEAIPGGPATKLPGEMAGRMAALTTARRTMDQAKEFYKNWGYGDRANQLLNRGKAGQAERTIKLGVEAALRAMTGAAAPESEVETYMNLFAPSFNDTQATVQDKLQRLESFMADIESNVNMGRTSTQPGSNQSGNALNEAKRAIELGAPRDKVIERLRQNGIDPSGL